MVFSILTIIYACVLFNILCVSVCFSCDRAPFDMRSSSSCLLTRRDADIIRKEVIVLKPLNRIIRDVLSPFKEINLAFCFLQYD